MSCCDLEITMRSLSDRIENLFQFFIFLRKGLRIAVMTGMYFNGLRTDSFRSFDLIFFRIDKKTDWDPTLMESLNCLFKGWKEFDDIQTTLCRQFLSFFRNEGDDIGFGRQGNADHLLGGGPL